MNAGVNKFSMNRDALSSSQTSPPKDANLNSWTDSSVCEDSTHVAGATGGQWNFAPQRRHLPAPQSSLVFSDVIEPPSTASDQFSRPLLTAVGVAVGSASLPNTVRRVAMHLKLLSPEKKLSFYRHLASQHVVERSAFIEALADVGCMLSKVERENIWSLASDACRESSGRGSVTVDALLSWLGVEEDIITAAMASTTFSAHSLLQTQTSPTPVAPRGIAPTAVQTMPLPSSINREVIQPPQLLPPPPPSTTTRAVVTPPSMAGAPSLNRGRPTIQHPWEQTQEPDFRNPRRTFTSVPSRPVSAFVGFNSVKGDDTKEASIPLAAGVPRKRHVQLQSADHLGVRDSIFGLLGTDSDNNDSTNAAGLQHNDPNIGGHRKMFHNQQTSAPVDMDNIGQRNIPDSARTAATPIWISAGNEIYVGDNGPYGGITAETRTALIAALQSYRIHLAVIFRRMLGTARPVDYSSVPVAAGTSIKCVECAVALRQILHPLSLTPAELSLRPYWALACDMAQVPHSTSPEIARISYADVIAFLDQENDKATDVSIADQSSVTDGPPHASKGSYRAAQIKGSLKRKLVESKYVLGNRLKLIALTPILRVRLKNQLSRGRMGHSWDGNLEFLSVSDMVRLLLQIDLELTSDEGAYIAAVTNGGDRDDPSRGGFTLEAGCKLAQVVLFLADLLTE